MFTLFYLSFKKKDQILEPEAKRRLSTLALVKKEKARSIEDSLINAARNGKLKAKVSVIFYNL